MRNRDMPCKPCSVDESRSGLINIVSGEPCEPTPLGFSGMTKLESAAIKAMAALLSCNDMSLYDTPNEWKEDVVEGAIEFANALFDKLEEKK